MSEVGLCELRLSGEGCAAWQWFGRTGGVTKEGPGILGRRNL